MIGQINRGSKFGDLIYDLILNNNFANIVEIGTWNGMGSTKVIRDAIFNKNNCNFYTIEASNYWYNEALKNNQPIPDNCHFLLGRIVDLSELDKKDLTEDEPKWLDDDINNYNSVINVYNLLPENIDFLLLDGGEFSSFAEFNKLKSRTTYIALDDTQSRKNRIVREIINSSKSYDILYDIENDRNGFMIVKRKI